MFGNGEFVSRDFYDICTAAEQEPRALARAKEVLTPSEKREIADEIFNLGTRAPNLGRPLVDVHRPEWLPSLARRTADLLLIAPKPVPEPAPRPVEEDPDDPFALPDPFSDPEPW